MAACDSCGATIFFLQMPSGARMPVDVVKNPAGNVVITSDELNIGRVLKKDEADWPGPRYMPHWRSCPHARSHKRGRAGQ